MGTFDDMMLKAKEMVDIAGKKTEEAVSYSKLKIGLCNATSDLNKAYQRLGAIVYDMAKNDLQEPELVDRCTEEIDLLRSRCDELREQMACLKNYRICPTCGNKCDPESKFCQTCGSTINIAE